MNFKICYKMLDFILCLIPCQAIIIFRSIMVTFELDTCISQDKTFILHAYLYI